MKNLNLKRIGTILRRGLAVLQRYAAFLFIISLLLVYGFLIARIGVLSQAEPSEEAVAEQSKTIKRLKLDESAIEKIQQLEDQNIGVQSLFEEARDNPFKD